MCAIKHINMEFWYIQLAAFACMYDVHNTTRDELIICLCVVSCCWNRERESGLQIAVDNRFHSRSQSTRFTNSFWWYFRTIFAGYLHHSCNHFKWVQPTIILAIHQNSMHFSFSTPMWQDVTFPWTLCVCGWNAEEKKYGIWYENVACVFVCLAEWVAEWLANTLLSHHSMMIIPSHNFHRFIAAAYTHSNEIKW